MKCDPQQAEVLSVADADLIDAVLSASPTTADLSALYAGSAISSCGPTSHQRRGPLATPQQGGRCLDCPSFLPPKIKGFRSQLGVVMQTVSLPLAPKLGQVILAYRYPSLLGVT